MTSTKIVAAGVLAAIGADVSLPLKTAFGATTRSYTLEVQVTNGVKAEATRMLKLELLFVSSNNTGTAANMVPSLALHAQKLIIDLKCEPGAITFKATKEFVATGTNLFTWFNCPELPLAAAVDLWLNEHT